MPFLDDIKKELTGWFDAALGAPLESALARVRQAVGAGQAETQVKPTVEAFIRTMTAWNAELARLEASAAQLQPPDPTVTAYVAGIREKQRLMWAQFSDPTAVRPLDGSKPLVGGVVIGNPLLVAIPATTAVVFSAVCAVAIAGLGTYAVSDVGAAWAVSSQGEAEAELNRTRLAAAELDARVVASREGRVLAPTTLPGLTAPRDQEGISTAIKVAAAGAGVAVVVAGLAYLLGGRRS
jgi:hypothetical protein